MELSDKSKEFYELFRTVRNEIATEEGYVLEHAIRLTFDRFCANLLLADSLPLSELKNLLCNVSQLIQGWNATEAEWGEKNEKMKTLQYLKKIHQLLLNPNQESLKLSLQDVHHKGIFSLVINGTEFGKLTRIFISKEKLKPYEVQLHTHRYPIKITIIKGNIRHYLAWKTGGQNSESVKLSEFDYKSPLNGGNGLTYIEDNYYLIKDFNLPVGSMIEMNPEEYHSMSCSKGSMWIVEEEGFFKDSSKVLGVPFITDGLYNKTDMFQVNDMCQLVQTEIKKIILSYEAITP